MGLQVEDLCAALPIKTAWLLAQEYTDLSSLHAQSAAAIWVSVYQKTKSCMAAWMYCSHCSVTTYFQVRQRLCCRT